MASESQGGLLSKALYPAQVAGLAAVYVLAAKLSLLMAIPPGYATPVWPPAGIALAALLLLGRRVWPGVWLGAAIANFGVEASLASALLIGVGNSLEAIVAAALVGFRFNPTPNSRKNCFIASVGRMSLRRTFLIRVAASAYLIPLIVVTVRAA